MIGLLLLLPQACMEEVRAVASRLAEAAATSSQADATLRADLTSLAEAVGAALGQVWCHTYRADIGRCNLYEGPDVVSCGKQMSDDIGHHGGIRSTVTQ